MKHSRSSIPEDPAFDSSLALLREGYLFIGNRCAALESDLFRTRIMLRRVVCMRGPSAAAAFYHPDRFTRRKAIPRSALVLLQDRGSVQTLDGSDHRHRKRMFMDMMDAAGLARVASIFREEWGRAAEYWAGSRIVLHEALPQVLARTALRWCGLPLAEAAPRRRAAELSAMIEGAGSLGPAHLRARILRTRCEAWARSVVRSVREGLLPVERAGPAESIALHRDRSGEFLPAEVAAVELINLLRPIVAVERFIVFAAHALHVHRDETSHLAPDSPDEDIAAFVQEVRRFYPFFPMIGGRVREEFAWRGHRFSKGDWVLLDLYGTNHHPDAWPEPAAFRPRRFGDTAKEDDTLVAQGGGDFLTGHRCPGEWLTIALVAQATRQLLATDYTVPEQDLSVPMNRLPALPKSGFVMDLAAPGGL